MRPVLSATLVMLATASMVANAETPAAGALPKQACAIGYVSGIGGAARSFREYLATPDRDKYRFLADNPMLCKVSDEGRTSGCTGVTNLRHEKVSVYDDIDDTTMSVVARVELDQGTYPVIISVSKQDVQCEQ